MKMSLKEVQLAAAALGNQTKAGLPLADATKRMRRLQKKYDAFWGEVSLGIDNGNYLSKYVDQVWPEAVVNAIKAGEQSGNLDEIFYRIETTIKIQREVNAMVMQLLYPAFFMLSGIGVFIFFMLKVIPSLTKSLGIGTQGFVFELSAFLTKLLEENWLVCIVVFVVTGLMTYNWLKDADNRAKITKMLVTAPIIGEALRSLYFGIWAHYMALVSASGSIDLDDGLILTSYTLPKPLRAGLVLMANEVITRGIVVSCDPDKQPPGDPRILWPFYVSNSFLVAETTGNLEDELLRAAPAMIEEGKATLDIALKIANAIALCIAGLLIAAPVMAYYSQLAVALQSAMKG